VFENVGFRYPDAEQWAVRHLDFQLQAGEVLALVGENGAGKTTLVKLLARLYEPDEGRILPRWARPARLRPGRPARQPRGDLPGLCATTSAPARTSASARSRRWTTARIADAARRGMAEEVIDDPPGGYDQLIGRRFKQGVDLSGGQWQKIAIARAWMRNAQVMILDEPTAALDARGEFEVFQRFRNWRIIAPQC
jgi:ATP-binding cassette subfamily B protein